MASDTFQYDAENRLKQRTQGSVTATYDYDGESRRVRKTSGSTATIYVYDAMGDVAAEYGGTPAPVGGTSYVAVDTLGSSRAEVDSQGNVTRHDYLPFGQEIPNSWGVRVYYNDYARNDGFTRKFTGKERDAETGLDYFGARYLSSAQGRWMIPDWSATPQAVPYADLSDPQTLNLYGYARNRPLGHADPDGHDVTFADLKLLFQFSRIAAESPSLESEYLLAALDKKMDVRVEERGLRKNEQNSPGDTKVSEADENGVTKVVIYVDGNGRTNDDTIVHEWGHEKDAREMGGTAFVREVKKQQSRYYEKGQHNERPVEESAERFKNNVNKERKQNQKRLNEQRKAEAKAEKERKRKETE